MLKGKFEILTTVSRSKTGNMPSLLPIFLEKNKMLHIKKIKHRKSMTGLNIIDENFQALASRRQHKIVFAYFLSSQILSSLLPTESDTF